MAIPTIRISIDAGMLNSQISGLIDLISRQQIICDDEFIEKSIADVVMGEGVMTIFEDGEKGIIYPVSMGETFNSFVATLAPAQTIEHLN